LEVTGGAVPILEGVQRTNNTTGTAQFGVSNTGSLTYIPGPVAAGVFPKSLAFIDRRGNVEPLKLPPRPYRYPRISPDGKRLAYETDDGKEAIIWVYDLSGRSAPQRLTFGGSNRDPIWTPDGVRVAFQSDREGDLGIFWQRADGGTAERLTKPDPGMAHIPNSWSPDGERLSLTVRNSSDDADVWMFSLEDKKAAPFAVVRSSFQGRSAFSPDGRWVAYTSSEAGVAEIYVQPFPATGARYQISKDGGLDSIWSREGKELFYFALPQLQLTAVSVSTEHGFTFGNPAPLPKVVLEQESGGVERNYDITPDGQRFIGVIDPAQGQVGTAAAPQINVVLNWLEELKQRVPVK
jgi:serine/threonine-protein kinase